MPRISAISPDKAKNDVKKIYQDLEKEFSGKIPNIFLNMGNSFAVLKGYLDLEKAASQTTLEPQLREQIALLVGQANHCSYCLSAHTAIAKKAGLLDQEIMQARHGQANNPKSQVILKFAQAVVENRGKITNQDIAILKTAGVSDTELAEIILVIIVNIFTNYFNLVTDPKIDFPQAPELNTQVS